MIYCAYCRHCNSGVIMRFVNQRRRDNWSRVHTMTAGHDKITLWTEPDDQ